jgi:hypothetical protein
MTTTIPDRITWTMMQDAGIDTELVERTREWQAGVRDCVAEFVATSADGKWRMYFGEANDPNLVIPEGEHKGWEATRWELTTLGDQPHEDFDSHYYEEPEDLAEILAIVAKIAPAVTS